MAAFRDPAQVIRELADAARPFGFRVEKTRFSLLPGPVFIRSSDGIDVARFRYVEPAGMPPHLPTVILNGVSLAEQAEIERHLEEHVVRIVTSLFSFTLWMALADSP